MKFSFSTACLLSVLLVSPAGARRPPSSPEPVPVVEISGPAGDLHPDLLRDLAVRAPSETTWLYAATFDAGGACTIQGWTAVDRTVLPGTYFHVDDFAGLPFGPLEGAKSLWCGTRAGTDEVLCQYQTLPGYGNSWDQAWCTKTCVEVTDGALNYAFRGRIDSEPGYDATTLEYEDCGVAGESWVVIDGGVAVWDGIRTLAVADSLVLPNGSYRVRLHFQSDGAWSDQDGLWPTNGAIFVDELSVENLPVEDFEGEAVGATASNDWQSCNPSGYGITATLLPGTALLQQDPCVSDLSCVWAFIAGSTANYGCGGFPAQAAVPFGNAAGQYLSNSVESPVIPLTGTGSGLVLEFSVYRDLPLDNLVFYNWAVRSIVNGCPANWKRRTSTYYGAQRDWHRSVQSIGDLVNFATATEIQVRLDAFDMCGFWCNVYGSGACHSHAPLFDNVEVYRVASNGPQWSVRDIDTFQDSFANDGTITGTVRADMALDILISSNPNILPGDSSVVMVSDPVYGLAADATLGGKAVYAWVSVWPQGQPAKTGAGLSGGARWPFAGTETIGGITWTKLRFDQAYTSGGNPVPNMYCIDLPDQLFTPGDTVCFFYGATSNDGSGSTTYFSRDVGTVDDITVAAAHPMEFTCLPAGGFNRGGDILYVDGMDGRGAQPYWDFAFQSLGILDEVDRYDVRGPSSGVNNRLESRVSNIALQLLGVYRKILWDAGDLSITLGDGSGTPEKTDDYGLLNVFLDGLTSFGGVYICGDDVSEQLNQYTSASATTFRSTYLSFTHVLANHRTVYGVSPAGVRNPAGLFGDDIVISGGCPLLNDFDVMQATGSALGQMGYGSFGANNHAVISQATSNGVTTVGVVFSGFAFEYIADDENDGVLDRAQHLHDIITWLGNVVNQPTGAGPALTNGLSQNYPNPFNPQTTIAFSIQDRGVVSVRVYNVAGALVRTLADDERAAGSHTLVWDGRNDAGQPVSSGVYFCRLVTGGFEQTRKMVVLK